MKLRAIVCALATLGAASFMSSTAQAQITVVAGGYHGGATVVVGRPVIPAVSYGVPSYSVGYAGYSAYSPGYVAPAYVAPTYVAPTYAPAYVAPAPVVTYRPVVPVYPAYRPGVVTARAYYPGQPVRNALRVIAP